MNTENRYNGWANYATWRVALEMFDGVDVRDMFPMEVRDDDAYSLSKQLEEYAGNMVDDFGSRDGLAVDYARAFLSDVSWYEIAEHMLENSQV
jgi:hypothetical protein